MNVKKMAVPIAISVMMVAVIFTVALTPAMAADPSDVCKDSIRLYGTFGEGAGNQSIACENKPYTDPEAPFFPQHPQAPMKDFMTFNPAIMDANQHGGTGDLYDELNFYLCEDGQQIERPQEKVFKRMWYEKEWFKDRDKDGCWDVVVINESNDGNLETWTLEDWNKYPEWKKVKEGLTIIEWNDPEGTHTSGDQARVDADIYAPSIVQEFTYMTLNSDRMPIMVEAGSEILIPMAHDPTSPYRGLNSFDADGDGKRDALRVESEATLDIDIDHKDGKEHMNPDGNALTCDESVVLVLGNKELEVNGTLQFFDHNITLNKVYSFPDAALFDVCDNEGGIPNCETNVELEEGETKFFYRGNEDPNRATLYLTLIQADSGTNEVLIEVGRIFGNVDANIGSDYYWNQKAFIVDGVFYSVAAILTGPTHEPNGDCFKYITIRQKLPKFPIKIYNKHLEVWGPAMLLPEMAPFCEDHEVLVDVLSTQSIPQNQQDKIGDKDERPPLVINYTEESIEPRFNGSLLEIFDKPMYLGPNFMRDGSFDLFEEQWMVEWFHTYPHQYTSFVLPTGELYLMTLGWYAPEAETTIWDGSSTPIVTKSGDRAKFWYDPADPTDIYVTKTAGGGPAPPPMYNQYDTNQDCTIDFDEVMGAVQAYYQSGGTDPDFNGVMAVIQLYYNSPYCEQP